MRLMAIAIICYDSVTVYSNQYCGEAPQPLDRKNAKPVQKALKNLSDFMSTANERENKNRQKLLRNLKVSYALKKHSQCAFMYNHSC